MRVRIRVRVLALLLVALSAAELAFSGSLSWRQTSGPEGGSTTEITANADGVVFVGTDQGGVFRSSDHGDSWTYAGLSGMGIHPIAVNAAGHLFVGSYESSVWRSIDDGQTWTLGNHGLTNESVGALVVDSQGTIFAGTGLYWDGKPGSGVFRSTDNGSSWTPVGPALADATITALAVGPGDVLFAGTAGRGVYRSTDHGLTWVPRGHDGAIVGSLLVHPAGFVLAGLVAESGTPTTAESVLFRSADNGDTWVNTGFVAAGNGVVDLAASSSGDIFVVSYGVFRSLDGGATWTEVETGLTDLAVNAIVVDSQGLVFAAKNREVARSRDNGEHWTSSRRGLIATRIRSIGFASRCLFASGHTHAGVSRSCDRGERWTSLGLTENCVESVVANARGYVFAGISPGCGGGPFQSGVLRTQDDGASWTPAGNPALMESSIQSLAINSRGHVFAGSGSPSDPFVPNQGRIFRSVDDGETWVELPTESIRTNVRALVVNGDDHLFAVAYNETTDGADDGLYRSTDDGDTWVKLNVPAGTRPAVYTIAVDRSNGVLFAMVGRKGVLRSVDNGDHWTVYNDTVPGNLVNLVADRGTVLGGTADARPFEPNRGVILFAENGSTWTTVNAGLTSLVIESMGISPDGFLYAGTVANGVFRTAGPLCSELGQPCPPARPGRRRTIRH